MLIFSTACLLGFLSFAYLSTTCNKASITITSRFHKMEGLKLTSKCTNTQEYQTQGNNSQGSGKIKLLGKSKSILSKHLHSENRKHNLRKDSRSCEGSYMPLRLVFSAVHNILFSPLSLCNLSTVIKVGSVSPGDTDMLM